MSYLKIKYADATKSQLIAGQAAFLKKRGITIPSNTIFKKQKQISNIYPQYDSKGNLTLVGKAMRLTDLEKEGLKKTATLEEYFSKHLENLQNNIFKIFEELGVKLIKK